MSNRINTPTDAEWEHYVRNNLESVLRILSPLQGRIEPLTDEERTLIMSGINPFGANSFEEPDVISHQDNLAIDTMSGWFDPETTTDTPPRQGWEEQFQQETRDEPMNDNYQEDVLERDPEAVELTTEEKLEKMHAILNEALANDKKAIGVVKSGPDAVGYYRVSVAGTESIHVLNENLDPETVVHGCEVIVCSNIVEFVLPEELTIDIEKLDFDRVHWADIRGLDSQIEDIKEAVEGPMENTELYAEFGLEPSKGLLLYGPSGTGKTMLAKAIATTVIGEEELAPESFVYMKGGEMLSKWVGEAEANIKNIFKKCREYTHRTGHKSIIFIDEADALLPERGSRKSSDVETTIVPTFLAEMDGLNNNNPFVILATNHAGQLDKAIVRPGRIDLRVEVKRPNEADALAILDLYYSKTTCGDSIADLCTHTLKYVYEDATLAASISGALLKNMVQKVSLTTIRRLKAKPRSTRAILLSDVDATFATPE